MEGLDFGVLNSSYIIVWHWNVQHGKMTEGQILVTEGGNVFIDQTNLLPVKKMQT